MPIDWTANDFDRADAARDAANERQHQIALRRFRRPWGCHPETNEAEPLEPAEMPDMLAASEAAEPDA